MQYVLLALVILYLLYVIKRQAPYARKTGSHQGISKEEAREILGVSSEATKEEIQQAYQQLIKKLHPDTGGSDYLTQQIINAKKVLDDE